MTNKRFSAKVVFASLIAFFLLLAYSTEAKPIMKGSYHYIDMNGKWQTVTWVWELNEATGKKTTIYYDSFLGKDPNYGDGHFIPKPAGMHPDGKLASPSVLDDDRYENLSPNDKFDISFMEYAESNELNKEDFIGLNDLDFDSKLVPNSFFNLQVKANLNEIEANFIFNMDNSLASSGFDHFEFKCRLIEMNNTTALMRDIPINVNEPTIIPVNGLLKEGISYVLEVSSPVGIEAYTIFQVSTNGDQIKK